MPAALKSTPRSGKHEYDESKIKTLSSLEHIRARTGMYIGRIGDGSHYDDGVYVLLKEVIDNSIDEFIMGHGHEIVVQIEGNKVTVRDFGRGIPLGKLVECVSRINTGAKYNDDVFQFSVGLNGVGTKAVNALSKDFAVASYREGEFARAEFKQGVLITQKKGKCASEERNGTWMSFAPDPTIFKSVSFREEHVTRRLRLYTYLNAGLKIRFNGTLYQSKDGLLDLIAEDTDDNQDALYPPLHFRDKTLELAFTHTQRFSETHYSFVNGQFTSDGGTHLSAFREGVLKAVNDFTKKKYEGDDVREGLVGAVAIRLKEPIFESQTKNKLGNTEIRADLVNRVRDIVSDLLHKNKEVAEKIVAKVEDTARLRRELSSVKKLARERSGAITLRIPQLKDCKLHLNQKRGGSGGGSMIFITEGQSAAGSIISCRDVMTQAIFVLKGKPLNVNDLKRVALYKNDELYNLMRALNVEESIEGLRYEKVILATDADVDGLHIRNLLVTFFLRFFPDILARGHLYILETPLFRVRNKKKTIYCYDEVQRVSALAELSHPEITRFKGLGEISPSEFKAFVGSDMRLSRVEVENLPAVPHILDFYMGKNTPERRNYIMDRLVVEPEEAAVAAAG
ncbi:MAG: type IIA DNA topoisomerase subunit B [Verrucomicrobia bacterium]|nr:type IIA DNA topoisomerase subunit B [Verrucomicrobiota bacterium]